MILCLDTIGPGGVAVIFGDSVLHRELELRHASERLLITVDELLKEAGGTVRTLMGVVAITGPGSFTGLRVGLSVANALAHSLKIPLVGLTTDVWWRARLNDKVGRMRTDEEVLFLQSLNTSEVYAGGAGILPLEALEALPLTQWVGPVTEAHRTALPKHFHQMTELLSAADTWKKIATAIDWKQTPLTLLEPFYGKPAKITPSRKNVSAQHGRT